MPHDCSQAAAVYFMHCLIWIRIIMMNSVVMNSVVMISVVMIIQPWSVVMLLKIAP